MRNDPHTRLQDLQRDICLVVCGEEEYSPSNHMGMFCLKKVGSPGQGTVYLSRLNYSAVFQLLGILFAKEEAAHCPPHKSTFPLAINIGGNMKQPWKGVVQCC